VAEAREVELIPQCCECLQIQVDGEWYPHPEKLPSGIGTHGWCPPCFHVFRIKIDAEIAARKAQEAKLLVVSAPSDYLVGAVLTPEAALPGTRVLTVPPEGYEASCCHHLYGRVGTVQGFQTPRGCTEVRLDGDNPEVVTLIPPSYLREVVKKVVD